MATLGDWKQNSIMLWDGQKVTDHGRSALTESIERIGTDKRMANGTLRRQYVANRRTWSVSWENIPSSNTAAPGTPNGTQVMFTVDGGMSGEQMESFYRNHNGKFRMVLRRGRASGIQIPNPNDSILPYEDANFYITNVMITEFSKEIRKRGYVDLWAMNVTLEEV